MNDPHLPFDATERPYDRRRRVVTEDFEHGRSVRVVVGSSIDELVVRKTGTNPAAVTAVEREALVLGQLRHPNVAELIGTELGPATATLITRFAGRATLAQAQPVDAAEVARIGAALLLVVGEIHALGWIHGRLTPEHCVVEGVGRLTLCAFGAAHRVQRGDPRILDDLLDTVAIITALSEQPRSRRPAPNAAPTGRFDRQ